jgi:hypothetical protein
MKKTRPLCETTQIGAMMRINVPIIVNIPITTPAIVGSDIPASGSAGKGVGLTEGLGLAWAIDVYEGVGEGVEVAEGKAAATAVSFPKLNAKDLHPLIFASKALLLL